MFSPFPCPYSCPCRCLCPCSCSCPCPCVSPHPITRSAHGFYDDNTILRLIFTHSTTGHWLVCPVTYWPVHGGLLSLPVIPRLLHATLLPPSSPRDAWRHNPFRHYDVTNTTVIMTSQSIHVSWRYDYYRHCDVTFNTGIMTLRKIQLLWRHNHYGHYDVTIITDTVESQSL